LAIQFADQFQSLQKFLEYLTKIGQKKFYLKFGGKSFNFQKSYGTSWVHSSTHRSWGHSWDVKKCKAKLRAQWKPVHQALQNQHQLDKPLRLPQNLFVRCEPNPNNLGMEPEEFEDVGQVVKLLMSWFSRCSQFHIEFLVRKNGLWNDVWTNLKTRIKRKDCMKVIFLNRFSYVECVHLME